MGKSLSGAEEFACRMGCALLLGLASLYCPLSALILDYNTIRGSAEMLGSKKGLQCQRDSDCSADQYCLRSDAKVPFCATCRGLRRRCQSSAMCCPGIQCVNDVCARPVKAAFTEKWQDESNRGSVFNSRVIPAQPPEERRLRRKPDSSTKGREGESCLRSQDCDSGLCCARHFWTKMCKPVLLEGEVCSKRRHKDTAQRPEIFQRCDCGAGLACRSQGSVEKPKSRLRVCQRQ